MPASPAQLAPGLRASAELIADAARSDSVIADAAQCSHWTVLRRRRELERAGVIEPVPVNWRTWRNDQPSRNPGTTARVMAQLALDPHRSTRAIAAAARCSHFTVLAVRRARAARSASAAAALDTLFA